MKSVTEEIKKSAPATLVIIASFVVYQLTDFYCGNKCGLVQAGDKQNILISGLLWFVPTLLVLVFTGKKIAFGWLRHIGWWFSVAFPVMVIQFSGGGVLSLGDFVLKLMMVILFIITAVYAFVTRKKFT
jgi:hypothetical protein